MKNTLLFKLFISLLLVVIALLLLVILTPFAILMTIIVSIVNTNGTYLVRYFKDIALSLDQLGNVICNVLFTYTFLKKDAIYVFGNVDETISSVLGKNKVDDKLTKVGLFVDYLLHLLEENHTIKYIDKVNNEIRDEEEHLKPFKNKKNDKLNGII